MTCPLGADIDFVYDTKRKRKRTIVGNEAEPPTIEKYLRTLMAKKLHGDLLVPQKLHHNKHEIQLSDQTSRTCDHAVYRIPDVQMLKATKFFISQRLYKDICTSLYSVPIMAVMKKEG